MRIGLVVGTEVAYPRGILRGVRAFARGKPGWVFFMATPKTGRLRKHFEELNPDGLIAHVINEDVLEQLRPLRKPTVNVSNTLPGVRMVRAGIDDRAVGRLAAAHLLDRGLRAFAFRGIDSHAYSRQRYEGFEERLAESGHEVVKYVEPRSISPGELSRHLGVWLKALPRPVGLFACNDIKALQIADACRMGEIRVPEDVALLGCDNDDLLCDLSNPALSSIELGPERIGRAAAEMLETLLEGRELPAKTRLLEPVAVVSRHSSDVLFTDDADVREAVRFIRAGSAKALSVRDVLRHVPVSRRALERKFLKALGRTPYDEIRRVRVERAQQLLAQTGMSMSEVASEAGFADAKHLSEAFGRYVGVPPTRFRKAAKAGRGSDASVDESAGSGQ